MTAGRRSPPIEQLKCLSGPARCAEFAPHVVHCYNKGHEGNEVQWQCSAQLDSRVKFGILKVSCEGYDGPNDPYILANSCGLEYTFTMKTKIDTDYYRRDLYDTNRLSNFLTWLIFIVIVLAIYRSCKKSRDEQQLQAQQRADLNDSYARVVVVGDYPDVYSPVSNVTNSASFPAPPPPYGFATMQHGADKIDAPTVSSGFLSGATPLTVTRTSTSATRLLEENAVANVAAERRSESPPPAYTSETETTAVTARS